MTNPANVPGFLLLLLGAAEGSGRVRAKDQDQKIAAFGSSYRVDGVSCTF